MPFALSALGVKVLAGLALVAALLLGYGLWQSHEQSLGAEREISKQTAQALVATQDNLRESNRRTVAVEGNAHAADLAASAARADADAAHSAGERLRLRLAAAERGRAASDPAATSAGATADAPGLVPYDVFESVRAAGERLAGYADQSRIAGQACERSYDALTKSAAGSAPL